jgi:uncharacterized circularly permuted ATP-grasp superfamily protein
MPLIIGAKEWANVEAGLIQRARLLESVVADVYGPQKLVATVMPAAVVAGSRYFARAMGGRPRRGHYIHVYAVDLARGPHGQWRVLGDRLRLANGVGYALENRLALSGDGVAPVRYSCAAAGGIFGQLRQGLSADCPRESPRIIVDAGAF